MKNTFFTRILGVLLITVILPIAAQATTVASNASFSWTTNYNEALERSKVEGKPVLLFFTGSDWCSWCTKLEKEVFHTQDFQAKAKDSFIFVELDFPSGKSLPQNLKDQNKALQSKFGVKGYPTVLIVDSEGNRLAETGYKSGGGNAYAAHLETLIQPHLAKFAKPDAGQSSAGADKADVREKVAAGSLQDGI